MRYHVESLDEWRHDVQRTRDFLRTQSMLVHEYHTRFGAAVIGRDDLFLFSDGKDRQVRRREYYPYCQSLSCLHYFLGVA